MIQKIEEVSLNAWPALQTVHYDGWIIRFADGVTKRSNSVNLLYDSKLDINTKIDYCESLYRSRQLPVCYKITEIAKPDNIDKILDIQGYRSEFEISVQILSVQNFKTNIDKGACIIENTDDMWLDNYIRMNEIDPNDRPVLRKIIDQIIFSKCLLTLKINELVVGCGLGVVEDKYMGLFDIVIDKQYRNQGLGKIMINNILRWGKSKGAEIAYLQVLTQNTPAIKMYQKVGFREKYKYWYRIKE